MGRKRNIRGRRTAGLTDIIVRLGGSPLPRDKDYQEADEEDDMEVDKEDDKEETKRMRPKAAYIFEQDIKVIWRH